MKVLCHKSKKRVIFLQIYFSVVKWQITLPSEENMAPCKKSWHWKNVGSKCSIELCLAEKLLFIWLQSPFSRKMMLQTTRVMNYK